MDDSALPTPAHGRAEPGESAAPRLLLVDDHVVVRRAIAGLLRENGFVILPGASTGVEGVALARQLHPDLILMDVRMPGLSGLEATRIIHQEMPEIGILMLTMSEQDDDLFGAIRAGARGYMLKKADEQALLAAIAAVLRGEAVIWPSMATKLLQEFTTLVQNEPHRVQASGTALTPREDEVLTLIAKGHSNRQISQLLSISENTVKTHTKNILEKLHLESRIQAALYASKQVSQK